MKNITKLLFTCMVGLAVISACSDDEVSTSSPFVQDVVTSPVTPPSLEVSFDQTEFTLAEGGDAVTVTLNLNAAAPSAGTITVARIDADSSTASVSDYSENFVGAISIAEGDESKELSIQATDDSELEDDEVVYFSVSSDVEILGLTSTVLKVTITSNEIPETVLLTEFDGDVVSVVTSGENAGDSSYVYTLTTSVEKEDLGDIIRVAEDVSLDLNGLTAMTYDAESGKGVAAAWQLECCYTDGEDEVEGVESSWSHLYEVDLTTGVATRISDEGDGYPVGFGSTIWDIVASTFEYFVASYVYDDYGTDESGYGSIAVDKADGIVGNGIEPDELGSSAQSIAFGGETDSLYYGGDPGEITKASIIDNEGEGREIPLVHADGASDTDYDADFTLTTAIVIDMEESVNGGTYAILQEDGRNYLVNIELSTGTVSLIAEIDSDHDILTVVPTSAL